MLLPSFRYHPDPLGSGSVVASDARCACCGARRGHLYAGPIYGASGVDAVCPWCIADGRAHATLGAVFVDAEAFDDEVPRAAAREIEERTPGYAAWQGEQWPACCGDATAFVMPAGLAELRARHGVLEAVAVAHVAQALALSRREAARIVAALDRDRGPTAYVFRCLHCARPHFHVDRP